LIFVKSYFIENAEQTETDLFEKQYRSSINTSNTEVKSCRKQMLIITWTPPIVQYTLKQRCSATYQQS